MKIIADQNIPFVKEAFRSLGVVETVAGHEITPELVEDADILLVRSVTKVNRELLEDSSVKFVATATIGTDHIDREWLEEAQIGFSSAPASNANSVAEWVITAMYLVASERGETLEGKTLAIVGVGNIGSRLFEKAAAIGMNVVLNDPPKAVEGNSSFIPLEDAVAQADYISFHVPLTYDGEWPTVGMINEKVVSTIRDGAVLINAARGRTLVEDPLLKQAGRLGALVLDVWPEEPVVTDALLEKCRLSAPHIAGYSFDGKCTGTGMIYRAACSFFFKEPAWSEKDILDAITPDPIKYTPEGGVAAVLLEAFDIEGDDTRMREISSFAGEDRISYFNKLRKEYPRRYEFCHFTVTGCENDTDKKVLTSLGFTLQ